MTCSEYFYHEDKEMRACGFSNSSLSLLNVDLVMQECEELVRTFHPSETHRESKTLLPYRITNNKTNTAAAAGSVDSG